MKKVKYIGQKPSIGLFLPVGTRIRSAAHDILNLKRGQVLELEDEEADKLCSIDKNFTTDVSAKTAEPYQGPKKVTQKKYIVHQAEEEAEAPQKEEKPKAKPALKKKIVQNTAAKLEGTA